MPIFEFDETQDARVVGGKKLCDFWGYNTVSFFAPNTSYTAADEYNREGEELKTLIKRCMRTEWRLFWMSYLTIRLRAMSMAL